MPAERVYQHDVFAKPSVTFPSRNVTIAMFMPCLKFYKKSNKNILLQIKLNTLFICSVYINTEKSLLDVALATSNNIGYGNI